MDELLALMEDAEEQEQQRAGQANKKSSNHSSSTGSDSRRGQRQQPSSPQQQQRRQRQPQQPTSQQDGGDDDDDGGGDNVDELLALMEEAEKEEAKDSSSRRPAGQHPYQQQNDNDSPRQEDAAQRQRRISSNLETKLDIRLANRKIGSSDNSNNNTSDELVELMSEYSQSYRSPASLCAMSRTDWNRLLQDPVPAAALSSSSSTTNADAAAVVSGRTNLLTVGIVLSNSGPRVATASGNAYCVLTIGTLKAGPCVSVFLFGSAYGQHFRSCRPGTVVAVVDPKLLPPPSPEQQRHGKKSAAAASSSTSSYDTSVSFAVSDAGRQFRVVGEARDFGSCKAPIRGKNERGQWVVGAKQCRRYTDTRISEYCTRHRQLGKGKQHPANTMQRLKSEAQQCPTARGGGGGGGVPTTTLQLGNQRQLTLPPNSRVVSRAHLVAAYEATLLQECNDAARGRSVSRDDSKTNKQQFFSATKGNLLRKESASNTLFQHPAKQQSAVREPSLRRPANTSLGAFPVATRASSAPVGNFLDVSKSTSKGPKRASKRAVNIDAAGFDGSVAVPKPSRVFGPASARPSSATNRNGRYAPRRTATNDDKVREEILARQRDVAAKMKANSTKEAKRARTQNAAKAARAQQQPTTFFDSIPAGDDFDAGKILAAKSKFSDEVEADEYVRSRNRVVELEQEEESKLRKKKSGAAAECPKKTADSNNHSNDADERMIEKEWFCATCGRANKSNPILCQRSNHNVKVRRKIKSKLTTDMRRQALSDARTEDGGLKIGSGLEWSKNRFSK